MKKLIGMLAAVSTLAFGSAALANDLMQDTYGNTVTVADVEGNVVVSYYFNEDGTFSVTGMDGTTAEGTWTLEGTTLCSVIVGQTNCTEIEDRDVGDSWVETDDDGNTATISIVAGRN